MQKLKKAFIIRTFPRTEPPACFKRVENLVFASKSQARQYADALEKDDYFWAYSIETVYFVPKSVKVTQNGS